MPGLPRALEPAQGSKVASGRLFASTCHKEGSVFWTSKNKKNLETQNTGPPQFKIPAADAVCVKVGFQA